MKPLYIEIDIAAPLDELWRKTQEPELHECWDLRFSSITYLPRAEGEPQKFRYATRLGALEVGGWGESTGEKHSDGVRTSTLAFGSDDWRALIETGSGYWKYTEREGGVRFVTGYDYQVRYGPIGRAADLLFRPWMGWATAWSFDRLRLWLEEDLDPGVTRAAGVAHGVSTLAVAGVWIWHGLVPKLIFDHPDETNMLIEAGVEAGPASSMVLAGGVLEILFGLVCLLGSRSKWPMRITALMMMVATFFVALNSPERLTAAFNPVTLNLSVLALALIALATHPFAPRASRCKRKP